MKQPPHGSTLAQGQLHLPQAQAFIDWLLQHWREEGVQVQMDATGRVQLVVADVGSVSLQVAGRQLRCSLDATSPRMLSLMQLSLTEHLAEFADLSHWPESSWHVAWDGDAPRHNARLHVMQVLQNTRIAPSMQRLRLAGPDVAALVQGGLHVRLLLPPVHSDPVWPTVQPDGRLQWPPGHPRMARRTYTIRAADPAQGWMEIDALRHGDTPATPHPAEEQDSPGASWAVRARPGSLVGVLAPAGGLVPQAGRSIVVADACAMPAAARIVQAQAPGHATQVLLWVADAREQAAWPLGPEQAPVRWLYGGMPGASQLEIAQVLQWLQQVGCTPGASPQAHGADLLWVAGGLPLTQAVRRWLAAQPVQQGLRTMVQTYWR